MAVDASTGVAGLMAALLLTLATAASSQKGLEVDTITTSEGNGYVFVHVQAGNLDGWGQAAYPTLNDASLGNLSVPIAEKIHEWVAPHALGRSFATGADIETFAQDVWDACYKFTGTLLAQALAGVDTALWDLVAKAKGVPVCALISGGSCRQSVKVYGSNLDRTLSPDELVTRALKFRSEHGVNAFKFKIAKRMNHDVDQYPNRTEEVVTTARQALGPDTTLMVDANGGFDNITHAAEVAKLLVANRYTWLEEPFPFWEYDKASTLHSIVPISIALGEQEYRTDVWQRNIDAIQFAQPDCHYIGGVSRTLQVARLAEKHNVSFVPHSPNPSMIDVFVLHLMAAVPNAYTFMEFEGVDEGAPSGNDLFSEPVFTLHQGAIRVPEGPGWGVELRPGLLVAAHNRTSRVRQYRLPIWT